MSQSERMVATMTRSKEKMVISGFWLMVSSSIYVTMVQSERKGVTMYEWKPATMVESLLPCFAPLGAISCRWALTYPSPETWLTFGIWQKCCFRRRTDFNFLSTRLSSLKIIFISSLTFTFLTIQFIQGWDTFVENSSKCTNYKITFGFEDYLTKLFYTLYLQCYWYTMTSLRHKDTFDKWCI